jgi:hypothetical protein
VTSADRKGRRRLDDPHDFLRLEILTALKRNVRVIPVTIGRISRGSLPNAPYAIRPRPSPAQRRWPPEHAQIMAPGARACQTFLGRAHVS